jgi:peptide/nickel transport system substrate-binding protein
VTPILAQSLAGCGIQVNLGFHPPSEWFAPGPDGRLYGRLFDLGELVDFSSIIPPCELFVSSEIPSTQNNWTGNTTGFNDPTYDAACNQQLQSLPGEAAYTQGVMDAQRIFAEQLPVVPLFLRVKYAAARPDMCGFWLDPTSQSDFWNIEAFDYGEDCK